MINKAGPLDKLYRAIKQRSGEDEEEDEASGMGEAAIRADARLRRRNNEPI